MRLLLLRHGEASFDVPSDALRPLTAQGQWQVRTSLELYLARESSQQSGRAGLTLCVSPLLRAHQTGEIVSAMFSESHQINLCREIDWLLPETSIADCVKGIDSLALDDTDTVVLVAHNPLLSKLWSFLCDGELYFQELATGQLVELECDWLAQGCASAVYQS